MIRRRSFLLSAAILSVVAILGKASPALADFQVRFSTDGGLTFTNSALQPGTNTVYVNIGQAVLTLTATASASSAPGLTSLDLSITGSLGDRSGAAGSPTAAVIVEASVNNIVTPGGGVASFSQSNTNLPPATIVQQSWAGGNNNLFQVGAGTGTSGPNILGASVSSTFNVPNTVNPYSATVRTIFNQNYTGVSISTDNNLQIRPGTAVPAPAGLVLLLSGTPVAGLAWLRRRKAMAV
jgi:hypothetical protein